eukprot:scaffold8190_cov158-Cylindrotheca_fusiformis.AAC.1
MLVSTHHEGIVASPSIPAARSLCRLQIFPSAELLEGKRRALIGAVMRIGRTLSSVSIGEATFGAMGLKASSCDRGSTLGFSKVFMSIRRQSAT